MARTDISWKATCSECTNGGSSSNSKNLWVFLSNDGKTSDAVKGELSGKGSTDNIVVSAITSNYYKENTWCNVTFTSENGTTATCRIERCAYECSCGSYNVNPVKGNGITVNGNKIIVPQGGANGGGKITLFKVESPNGCPFKKDENGYGIVVSSDTKSIASGIELTEDGDVTCTTVSNSGRNETQVITFINAKNTTEPCFTYSLSQEGAKCNCEGFSASPATISSIPASGKSGYTATLTTPCARGDEATLGLNKNTSVTWVDIKKGASGENSDNKYYQNYTIDVEERKDSNRYKSTRTTTLTATTKMTGDTNEMSCKTITISQNAYDCDCGAFQWVSSTNLTLNAPLTGISSFSAITNTNFTNLCDSSELSFPANSSWVSATTTPDNRLQIVVSSNATGCENERSCTITPMINGVKCGNRTITVKQPSAGPCYTCGKCTDISISPSSTLTFNDDSAAEKTIASGTFKGPTQCGSDNYQLFVHENTASSWLTVTASGLTIKAKPKNGCSQSCVKNYGDITIGWKYNGNEVCTDGRVKISVEQECSSKIKIEADKQLDCNGGPVTFSIKYE